MNRNSAELVRIEQRLSDGNWVVVSQVNHRYLSVTNHFAAPTQDAFGTQPFETKQHALNHILANGWDLEDPENAATA